MSPRNIVLVSTAALLLGCTLVAVPVEVAGQAETSPRKEAKADDKQLEAWWTDLERGEEDATRALLQLSARPSQAVDFLKDRMKPLGLDSVRLRAFLLRLGSENEKLWKQAFDDLEYYDPRLAMELPDLMAKITDSPVRERLVEVLSARDAESLKGKQVELLPLPQYDGYNFKAENGTWWAEHKVSRINSQLFGIQKRKWTRAIRAIVLLEYIGTPAAVAIVKEMATGHPDAQPTKAAKQALERIAREAPHACETPRGLELLASVGSCDTLSLGIE